MVPNTIFRIAIVVAAAVSPALSSAQGTAAATAAPTAVQAPDVLIRDLSNDVLETIRKDPTLQSGDVTRINKLIDDKVLPVVNFEKMTRLAVGRGWRSATPEQRAALTREFRTLLVRTYSGAVSAAKDYQVKLQPLRMKPDDTDVLVRTSVVPSRGDAVQLDYRLEKSDAGWKIYDINVLGVWLVENYKNQFSAKINADGVDGLIKQLMQQNAGNESKKS